MYLPIFYKESFSSADEIQYITVPIAIGGWGGLAVDLHIQELSKGSIVRVQIEQSGTGDYDTATDWVQHSAEQNYNTIGHKVINLSQFLPYLRFKLTITNRTGRAQCKISLSGHLTRRA